VRPEGAAPDAVIDTSTLGADEVIALVVDRARMSE
jgi:hypothetical protein